MRIVDKKPYETPPNIFYGVDVTDKKAVKKKYHKLQFQHFIITMMVIAVLSILGVFIFDMIRVNFMDKHPMFYKVENIDGGTLYKGLGYSKLYCDNGEVYNYMNNTNKCLSGNRSFSQVFYSSFKMYAFNNEIITDSNLKMLKLSNITYDGTNSYKGSDYVVDVTYSCLDETSKCFKELKKQIDPYSYRLFVSLNSNNHVEEINYFKNYGYYYDALVSEYNEKVKNYMSDNGLLDLNNLYTFEINILADKGKVKYKQVEYYNSYLIKINYSCVDLSDTCISKKEYTTDKLTNFDVLILVDENRNVLSIANKAILDL